jgi:hypothetical protein
MLSGAGMSSRASAACGLPRPPPLPGTSTYTDGGAKPETFRPAVFTSPARIGEGTKPEAGLRLAAVRLSRRDAVSHPAPGWEGEGVTRHL